MVSRLAPTKADAVASDRTDIWNRQVRFVVLPILFVYVVHALLQTHTTDMIVSTSNEEEQTIYHARARDSGLLMTLKAPFPSFLQDVHIYSAILLFIATFVQKELVRRGIGLAKPAAVHHYLGYFVLLMANVMNAAGFFMGWGDFSNLDNFTIFIWFFAAPWPLISLGIYFSAKLSAWQWHRLFANALLKACIAVPMSRVLGAVLQRNGWEHALGYYTGIIGSTILIGLWQIADIVQLLSGTSTIAKPKTS